MYQDLERTLFPAEEIAERVRVMAAELAGLYCNKPLTVVAVLNGGLFFTADLLRALPIPLKLEALTVASYHGGTESSGTVTFRQNFLPEVEGRHVLLVDDILDTGRTLAAIRRRLEEDCAPASVRTCVLLDKTEARVVAIQADHVGFEIGNEFVVGYGLDYNGEYRNLPEIGVLRG